MKKQIKTTFYPLLLICLFSLGFSIAQQANETTLKTLKQSANIFERTGNYKQAADWYIEMCRREPKNLAAYMGAKRNLLRIPNYDKLEQLIIFLKTKRSDIRYEVDLALIDYKRGNVKRAKKRWSEILDKHKGTHQAYAFVGQAYIETGLYDDAIDVYKRARKAFENPNLYIFNLANIYRTQGKIKELIDEYLNYIQENPQQIYYIQSQIEQSVKTKEHVKEILVHLKDELNQRTEIDWAIHLILADVATLSRLYDIGYNHYISFETKVADTEAKKYLREYNPGQYLYSFARTALQDGQVQIAQKAFETIIEKFPNSNSTARSQLGLAQVYESHGNYERSLDHLNHYAKNNPQSRQAIVAMMRVGDIYLHNLYNVDMARQAFQYVVDYYPDTNYSLQARFKLSECALATNDFAKAEKYLKKVAQQSTEKQKFALQSLYRLAQLEFYRQRPKKALSYLNDFFKSKKNMEELENDALELSMLLTSNINDSTSLAVYGKASLLHEQQQYDKSAELMQDFLSEVPGTPLRDKMLLLLSQNHRQMQNYDQAVNDSKAVYENDESLYRDKAAITIAVIYEKELNNIEMAKSFYEKVLVEFPNSIYVEQARERLRDLENKG